jgi:hypothetical protein
MPLRKSIYSALLALLPLVIAGVPAGQALAGTQAAKYPVAAPAAEYIGADAYHNPTWPEADTPSSTYYIGPLDSEKFFYNGKPLPSSDAATTYQYNVPGCDSNIYPTKMLCIIVWNTAASTTGADLEKFLESTLTNPRQILMAFCNEPEYAQHHGPDGCVCDLPGSTEKACDSSAAFISQFEIESNYIRAFESEHHATNVKVAEISGGEYYASGTNGCSVNPTSNPNNFIVPHQYVDDYLVDIYEGGHGDPISQPKELGQDAGWKNWVTCTKVTGVARGIAEFGINCGYEAVSQGHGYEKAVAQSFTEDDTYLKDNFPNLVVWNVWDYGGCALNNPPSGVDEPDSVAAWQKIAAGN